MMLLLLVVVVVWYETKQNRLEGERRRLALAQQFSETSLAHH
jgi:hypothetical protein